jgi:hypothetical protein
MLYYWSVHFERLTIYLQDLAQATHLVCRHFLLLLFCEVLYGTGLVNHRLYPPGMQNLKHDTGNQLRHELIYRYTDGIYLLYLIHMIGSSHHICSLLVHEFSSTWMLTNLLDISCIAGKIEYNT